MDRLKVGTGRYKLEVDTGFSGLECGIDLNRSNVLSGSGESMERSRGRPIPREVFVPSTSIVTQRCHKRLQSDGLATDEYSTVTM